MIIGSGKVAMSAERAYEKNVSYKEVSVICKEEELEMLDFSDQEKSLARQLTEGREQIEEQRQKERLDSFYASMTSRTNQRKAIVCDSAKQLKLMVAQKILELLSNVGTNTLDLFREEMQQYDFALEGTKESRDLKGSKEKSDEKEEGTEFSGAWRKVSVISSFVEETEQTAFETVGTVKTSDGKEFSFQLSLELSRTFCEKNETLLTQSYHMIDPLVINFDCDAANVQDMKFFFDLDCDGKEEEISRLGKGSGFLALDKNGDGVINDGSELFGVRSGDGFAELGAYDKDHNQWIDEADEIFNQLKIWVKNEDGTDTLLSLKEAGVGAIYLGNASTQFALSDSKTNELHAMLESTGIYLAEDGTAGTVQHLDFAV